MKNIFDTTHFADLSSNEYKSQTVNHWSKNPCGSNYGDAEFGSREYFAEVEAHRYFSHPWIKEAINRFEINNKNVLEIGFGMGTDYINLARRGAIIHGTDLTPGNIKIVTSRLEQEDLVGELLNADAENLPYADNSMDFVYSFGVIHHSPDTEQIISEIHRVLKPNGRCLVSVYHKNSIFFWWTTCLVNYVLKRGWRKRTLQQQLSLIEYPGTNENMVIRLYKRKEFEALFSDFSKNNCYVRHLLPCDVAFLSHFFKNRDRPIRFLNMLGSKVGWYVVMEAVK